ncbi:MAG: hypothetical protein AB7D39_20670 [Pseudodesulfovibrio sp.]
MSSRWSSEASTRGEQGVFSVSREKAGGVGPVSRAAIRPMVSSS